MSAAQVANVRRQTLSEMMTPNQMDGWYNEVYSANSELSSLPFPLPPAIRGIPERCMCSRTAYRKTYELHAGHTAVLVLNKHAGPINLNTMPPIIFPTDTLEHDYLIFDYASSGTSLQSSGPWDTNASTNSFTDLLNTAAMIPVPVPPVNGTDPRDLLQPTSRNGSYVFLGGSMSMQVTTAFDATAQMFAADTNQNPKNWGDRGQHTNWYHPGNTSLGAPWFGDGQYVPPGTVNGTMEYPLPPLLMKGLPSGGAIIPQDYGTWNPTVADFFAAYKSVSVPGNSVGSAYAQIAGDHDITPGCGILTNNAWHADLMAASGEFPVCSTGAVLLSSGCCLVVTAPLNKSVQLKIECTASWCCPIDPILPEYLSAHTSEPHTVRNMSYINTALCLVGSMERCRSDVKNTILGKMVQETDSGSRLASEYMGKIDTSTAVASATTGRPMTRADNSSLLQKAWSSLKSVAKDKIVTYAPKVGEFLLKSALVALGI